MTIHTIAEIEKAINFWRAQAGGIDVGALALGPEARALGDVYGLIIYDRRAEVNAADLTEKQKMALQHALSST